MDQILGCHQGWRPDPCQLTVQTEDKVIQIFSFVIDIPAVLLVVVVAGKHFQLSLKMLDWDKHCKIICSVCHQQAFSPESEICD